MIFLFGGCDFLMLCNGETVSTPTVHRALVATQRG